MFVEEIKQALLKNWRKNTNESTLDIYIKNASNLLRDVFGKDLNKIKNLNWIDEIDKIEKYFDEKNRSISTRRNYYNALLEIGISMNHPVKPVKEIRDKYADEYNNIEDGLKSKKQEENFCSAKILNDKIDEYEKEIKKGNDNNIQVWIMDSAVAGPPRTDQGFYVLQFEVQMVPNK